MLHEVKHTARVAPLIVIPGNKLDEGRVQHDTGTRIENGGTAIALEVSRHKGLVTVSKDALHRSLRLGLDGGADLLVGGLLSEASGQVNNRHIDGGDAEGHAGDLALERGDDLGAGLGSTSGGGVDNGLRGGHGVDGGHEGLLDLPM